VVGVDPLWAMVLVVGILVVEGAFLGELMFPLADSTLSGEEGSTLRHLRTTDSLSSSLEEESIWMEQGLTAGSVAGWRIRGIVGPA
jgi:hypothetical protein